MADIQNPLGDGAFRDLSPAEYAQEEKTLIPGDLPDLSHKNGAQTIFGRSGHQRLSGPLAPLPGGGRYKGHTAQQGKRRKWLPLALGAIGVIVILGCLGVGATVTFSLLSFQSTLNSPQTTLNDFYNALHASDYHNAYAQLSNRYQQELDYNTFQAKYATLDALNGPIEKYQISNLQTQSESATATVKVVHGMQTGPAINEIHTIGLILEASDWKIDRITINQTPPG